MYHFSFLNTKQNIPVERACPTTHAVTTIEETKFHSQYDSDNLYFIFILREDVKSQDIIHDIKMLKVNIDILVTVQQLLAFRQNTTYLCLCILHVTIFILLWFYTIAQLMQPLL